MNTQILHYEDLWLVYLHKRGGYKCVFAHSDLHKTVEYAATLSDANITVEG